jgi:DNA-directed RNA polymerase specialized sigma24 family protein
MKQVMPSDATTFSSPAPHNSFPTTQWTVVLNSTGPSRESEAALEELCRAYWRPLYVFARRSGVIPHDAQDRVQGFIQRLLERRDLANISPDRGRFRTYLLVALRNFMIKQAEHHKAAKRGGGKTIISLNAEEAERFALPDLNVESAEGCL